MVGAGCKGELSAGDAEADDAGGVALVLEDLGAFVEGGSGGEHVVDEEDVAAFEGALTAGLRAEGEGVLEIGEAVFAIEGGLAGGIALAAESGDEGEVGVPMEAAGNFVSLIELAVAQFSGMQRHGGEDPVLAGLDAWLLEGLEKQLAEHDSELELSVVFKMVNEIAHGPAAFVTGEGEIKGHGTVLAVGTDDGQAGVCREGFRAALAIGRGDGGELFRATAAEAIGSAGGGQWKVARGALQRKKQVGEGLTPGSQGIAQGLHDGVVISGIP